VETLRQEGRGHPHLSPEKSAWMCGEVDARKERESRKRSCFEEARKWKGEGGGTMCCGLCGGKKDGTSEWFTRGEAELRRKRRAGKGEVYLE